uniref:MOG interacting and ectopic P-granules protein 1 n=1 Tax=Caenorhabditis tropicalis TaxID=1561998 RepID=A0A1I7T513_9PELO
MVTADETVLATTTNTAPIPVESTEPKSSDESSDSDSDKIEKLKAEQREVLAEPATILEVNGNEENGNGATTTVMEKTDITETNAVKDDSTVIETTTAESNGTDEITTVLIEESVNGNLATTSDSKENLEEKLENDIQEVVSMETDEKIVNKDNSGAEQVEDDTAKTQNGVHKKDDVKKDAVLVLDDEETLPELISGDATSEETAETPVENHSEAPTEDQNGKGVKRAVDIIQLDDDDDDIQEVSAASPPAKKQKVEETKQEIKKDEQEGNNNETAQKRLLDKLEEYVNEQKQQPSSKNRKVLDTLLGAINSQVQKEPLSVRKLILDKVLVLPNTISFPPSQVCDILIEHDPDMVLSKVITRMLGEERPKLSDSEKRDRAILKQQNAVPNMTKLLVDIGQDLVQEATYCDIVHAKNLPEVPKNLETYKQVAAQLKPVWETLKRKNEPYKMKMSRCGVCGFQTESKLVMTTHKQTLHNTGTKFQCTFCKETDTNEQRMKEHYFEVHLVIAIPEEKESKYPCAICEEDFNFKGVREQHYKQCKKDYIRIRNIMTPRQEDNLFINRWLWERPQIDPSILQQQQQAAMQQAQQKKQQQQQLINQQQAAQAAAAQLIRKQQMQQQAKLREQQQQAQIRQMTQLLQHSQKTSQNRGNTINNSLIQAMQAQLRQNGQGGNAMAKAFQQQLAAAIKTQQQAAQLQAAMASLKNQNQRTPTIPKAPKVVSTSSSSSLPSAGPSAASFICEICDQTIYDKEKYLSHLQSLHKQMIGKTLQDMAQGAPLACSRCRDRFWTYEGLERHLVMSHGLVTADLLLKAQKKEDGGRCKTCGKQYAFNMLQHLVADHQVKLCSAEIMYSCDVCCFKCASYQTLENHLTTTHPKGEKKTPTKKEDYITLDD